MDTQTVTASAYADLAAELRRMADDLDTLTDQATPAYVTFGIQPNEDRTDEAKTIAAVDAVATALLGHPGKPQKVSGGGYHYQASGKRDRILVDVYQRVTDPERRALAAELDRLRAEVAALRPADPDHGRTTAALPAKPDTLLVPHGDQARANVGR
jgi:hypothetical protein